MYMYNMYSSKCSVWKALSTIYVYMYMRTYVTVYTFVQCHLFGFQTKLCFDWCSGTFSCGVYW